MVNLISEEKKNKCAYVTEPAIPTCPQSMQFFPITTLWAICKLKDTDSLEFKNTS